MTTNRDIPFAKSLVDYIFRWMGMEFIEGYRKAGDERLLGWARSHSVSVIYLGTTSKVHAAHRFYEKHGFIRISRDNNNEKI